MAQTTDEAIGDHFREIRALSLTEESANEIPEDPSPSISTFLSLSLFIFFFVVVFLGFLPLVIERFRDFKRFYMALLLATVGAALPLTLGLLFQQNGLLTQASLEEMPQKVVISDLTSSSFRVSWETNGNMYGALRYSLDSQAEDFTHTSLEVGGLLKTNQHEVFVEELTANTDYYFQILSGSRWYDNNHKPLSVRTHK